MNVRFSALLLCLPPAVMGGTSADYTLSPETADGGGGRGLSAAYAVDFSLAPGGEGSGATCLSRTGFAGQLDDVTGLEILLSPSTLDETATGQLRAGLLSTAGLRTDLPAGTVSWTILSGPLTEITPAGLVTAGTVFQTTPATVQAASAGFAGTLGFPVNETIPDNFGLYAADRLPDGWQVQHLGPAEPGGGPAGDPDHDGFNNLLEFAFGTDPADTASGSGGILQSGGLLTSRGQPVPLVTNIPNSVDFRVIFGRRRDFLSAGLLYQVQFSSDLLSWTTGSRTPLVLAQDAEIEAVSVPWPFFLNGRKARFFRVMVSFTPVIP